MAIPDMPNVPPQDVPVMIAQANQAQVSDMAKIRTAGVCQAVPNHDYGGDNGIEPVGEARAYFQVYEQRTVTGPAITAVLQQPKHGILRTLTEDDRGILFSSSSAPLDPTDPGYVYLPKDGYVGKDSATIQVDFGGVKVNVKYYFQSISSAVGNEGSEAYCGRRGIYWKISSTLDVNGNSTITSVEYQSPFTNTDASVTTAQWESKNSFFGMKRKEPRSE